MSEFKIDLKEIMQNRNKKKPITLYLDGELIKKVRKRFNPKSISSLINDILEQIIKGEKR